MQGPLWETQFEKRRSNGAETKGNITERHAVLASRPFPFCAKQAFDLQNKV